MKKAIRFVFVGVFTLCAIGTFSELAVAKRMQDRVAPTLTTEPIVGQTETLLPDGRVLLVGGKTGSGGSSSSGGSSATSNGGSGAGGVQGSGLRGRRRQLQQCS